MLSLVLVLVPLVVVVVVVVVVVDVVVVVVAAFFLLLLAAYFVVSFVNAALSSSCCCRCKLHSLILCLRVLVNREQKRCPYRHVWLRSAVKLQIKKVNIVALNVMHIFHIQSDFLSNFIISGARLPPVLVLQHQQRIPKTAQKQRCFHPHPLPKNNETR